MYLLRMPRWARMEAGQIKGHQFSIVASPINISRTVPSSLYVTQRIPSMIAKNQVFSTNFFSILSQLPPRSDNSFCEPTKTTLDTFASDDLGPSKRSWRAEYIYYLCLCNGYCTGRWCNI